MCQRRHTADKWAEADGFVFHEIDISYSETFDSIKRQLISTFHTFWCKKKPEATKSRCNLDGNEGQPPLIDSKQGGTHGSTRGGGGPFIDVNHYDGKDLTMSHQKLDFFC